MKNILLFFASPFLLKEDENKHLFPLEPTEYKFNESVINVYQTNESAVKFLCQKLERKKFDKIFIFTSKKVGKPLKEEEQRVVEKVCEERPRQDFPDVAKNSHLFYFLKRIAGYYEDLKIVNYNENAEIDQSLGVMMEMALAITEYKKLSGDDEVVLYADMTGGMRNASMMMLGTMRYLEYSDIKLGEIVYSNKVGEKGNVEYATDVYRFFDLVAGAKDFKNYGSVYEIDNYIKQVVEKKYPSGKEVDRDKFLEGHLSMELNVLLNAMRDFSEQIKLCFYGDFIRSIENLKKCVGEFEKHVEGLGSESSKDNYDYLCHCMLPTIYKEYKLLFKDASDDLDYIEWCVNHGYYQQALTLYTERVPEYIFEKGIVVVKERSIDLEDFQKYRKKDDNITFPYWIMDHNEYGVTENDPGQWQDKNIKKDIGKIFNCILTTESDFPKTESGIQSVVGKLKKIKEKYGLRVVLDERSIVESFEDILSLPQQSFLQVRDKLKGVGIYGLILDIFKTERPDVFVGNIDGLTNIELMKYADKVVKFVGNSLVLLQRSKKEDGLSVFGIKVKPSLDKNFYGIKHLCDDGYLDCFCNSEMEWKQLKDTCKIYTLIRRDMRNVTNHARKEKSEFNAENIKDTVLKGLALLREEAKIVEQRRNAVKN